MRRTAALVLAAATSVALVLAGCGGDQPAAKEASGDVTTVTVWDRGGSQAAVVQRFFQQWNRDEGRRRGIRVNYVQQAPDKYEEVVRLGFQTRRAPDLFQAPQAQIGAWATAGWVESLKGKVDEGLLKKYSRYLVPDGPLVIKGEPYALPSTSFTTRLVYNEKLLAKAGLDPATPPRTMSQLRSAAEAVTKSGGGKVYGMALPVEWIGFGNWIVDLPVLASDRDLAGTGLFNTRTGKYETTRYAPVVSTYRELVAGKSAYPGASSLNYDDALAAYAQGKVAMMITSSDVVSALEALKSTQPVSTAPLPVPDGTRVERLPMNAGIPYALSALSEHPDESVEVLEILAGANLQKTLLRSGAPPVDRTLWDAPEAAKHQALAGFEPGALDRQWGKTPTGLLELQGENVPTVLAKLVLDPDVPVEPTLRDLQNRLQKAYDAGVKAGQIDASEY